ncbi:MAG: GGDEF domain-containing protein, partial [Myxococcales bacterium]|nr:GGDEF domain-containing protein [Myxococcales bacterium]
LAGDYVLKEVCNVARSRLRPDDILARYGGEEFAIILPETTTQGALRIGEELRALIEEHEFIFEGETIKVTVSLGAAELTETCDVTSFIKRADNRLYAAKRGGRNRIDASS